MATEYLLIRVDQRGARATSSAVRGIGTAAKQSHSSVNLLKNALLTLGVAIGVRELKETVDTFIQIKNRIRLATNSAEEYTRVSKEIFDVSQETRAPLEATAELYRRLAVNTRGLGIEQDDLIGIIKTINQSIAVSGATAKEARSGLIQLAQGFASGQLRGEEFRSVAEQLPGLMIAIADGLGKTIGELRTLAFAGKLSPELVAKAIQSQAEIIDATFKQITPTIEQAGIQLENSFINFIGKINEATRGSESFRDLIGYIRANIDRLATALFSAAAAYGLYKLGAFGAAAATRLFAMSVRSLLAATGVGAIVVALGLAIDALITFGLTTEEIGGVSVSGFNKIGASITAAAETVKILVARFREAYPGIEKAVRAVGSTIVAVFQKAFGINKEQFKGFLQNSKRELNTAISLFTTTARAFTLAWKNVPAAFAALGIKIANSLSKPIQEGVNYIIREINAKLGAFLPEIAPIDLQIRPEAAGPEVANITDEIAKIFKEESGKDFIGDFIDTVAKGGRQVGEVFTQEYNKALEKTIENLQKQADIEEEQKRRIAELKAEMKAIDEAEALNAQQSQKVLNATRTLAGLTDRLKVKREAAGDPLDADLERYKQAEDKARKLGDIAGVAVKDNEALALALEGQARIEQEKTDLSAEQERLLGNIDVLIESIAQKSPEFAAQMRAAKDEILAAGGGLERVVTGLKGLEKKGTGQIDRQTREAEREAAKVGQEIASGLTDAFRTTLRGEAFDWAEWLADKSAQLFEKSMEEVFTSLAKTFKDLFQKASDSINAKLGQNTAGGGGFNFGAGLSALVGVGGLLLSAAMQKSSADIQNELADQTTAVTDVRPVRGVVAGPTNIPIFQLGQELEDAMKPTNEILTQIRDAVVGGIGGTAATAVTVEEQATQLLNASSPTLF